MYRASQKLLQGPSDLSHAQHFKPMIKQPETIARGIRLRPETWKAFDRLRNVHGSYDKALAHVLSAGGVFESERCPNCEAANGILCGIHRKPAGLSTNDALRIGGHATLLKPKDRK